MKKLAALILILMLACAALTAMAEDLTNDNQETNDFPVGTWYLYEVKSGDDTIAPVDMGMTMKLVFLNNFKEATLKAKYGEEAELESQKLIWAPIDNGFTLTSAEEQVEFIHDTDKKEISCTVNTEAGNTVTFKFTMDINNVPEQLPKFEPIDNNGQSTDAFQGTWALYALQQGDNVVRSRREKLNVTITIEDNKVSVQKDDESPAEFTLKEDDLTFEAHDGTTLTLKLNKDANNKDNDNTDTWLSLNLGAIDDNDNDVLVLYFAKVEPNE